eukprot:TRINITY_DN4787_c0_g2_i1.p1 TRINITY_DN4787_c0_g2~~TRINITY_DN4787_c0_g2_i1.p1  ORF type:complete len:211 (+),score=45.40 TRINITY_DN4787_c0_g2_i1:127-759(+)
MPRNNLALMGLCALACIAVAHAAGDPCVPAPYISSIGLSLPVLPGTAAVQCLEQLTTSQSTQKTILDVLDKYLESYSYVDKNINSGPPYNIKVDIRAELAALGKQTFDKDIDFQDAINSKFIPMHDAHTQYRKPGCYGGAFIIPLQLGSAETTGGSQIINVIPPFQTFANIQPVYDLVFPDAPSWSSLEGKQVVAIDGQPALDALKNVGR